MAGLIAALFGGKSRPPDPNPLPGLGGVSTPPGPAGQTGYPGSTSATRTFGKSASPRAAKLDKDRLNGANTAMGTTTETRQIAGRGGEGNPRDTPAVTLPQTAVRQELQHNSPVEVYGGQALTATERPGSNTVGGNPLSPARRAGGHSVRDTETPMTRRQPVIGAGTPGAQNVRNSIAQRYKGVPGQTRGYLSAPNPGHGPVQPVTVEDRFVFPGGGNTTWTMLREMPYGGRGDGARGADMNGTRYYATGQSDQFWNGGSGDYGIARERGNKRPVSFTKPSPWSSNVYDTTDSVGTATSPGTNAQAPNAIYVSPNAGRASNSTGRTG